MVSFLNEVIDECIIRTEQRSRREVENNRGKD